MRECAHMKAENLRTLKLSSLKMSSLLKTNNQFDKLNFKEKKLGIGSPAFYDFHDFLAPN